MPIHVALLRGINVGGHARVAMADLRALCEDLGHREVRTYVQSGNVGFTSDETDTRALAEELAARLARDLDVSPAVVVRSAAGLAAVVAANPFPTAAADDPTTVHVAFLTGDPADPTAFDVDAAAFAPEELAVGDRVLYLHLPGGIGRSRLAAELARRRTGVDMTVRNWRTVDRLLAMASPDTPAT